MKRFLTHLFVASALMLIATNAWAQETTELELNFANGTCNTTATYCSVWTSTTEPVVTISVASGDNNLVVNPASGAFEMHEGSGGCTYKIAVNGYRIVSYSFTYKTKLSGNDVTITANGNTYTSSDTEKTLEVTDVNSPGVSLGLSGNNKGIIVTNLKLVVSEILTEGKVYMFRNARADRSLSADGADDVHTKTTDAADTKQHWYVTKDGDYYVLRNLAYGKYLKGALTRQIDWTMTDDYSATENKFDLLVSNTTFNTLKTKDSDQYGHMHDDNNGDNGGYNIKGWENGDGNTGSHWTITEVSYTAEELKKQLDAAPTIAEVEAWGVNFLKLFNDGACLVPAYNTLAIAQETDDYKFLSGELQALVDKIYNKTYGNGWAEDNADSEKEGWDDEYAKKFRVQMYEPYSLAGDITSFLRMNAHANNDNPTGIYVAEAGTVYVMVEGEVKNGATLRLVNGGSNGRITNAASAGYALEPGLNIINFTEATGMLYVCYNVDTYNPDGATVADKFPHKLSDYAPLKIHIEGGAINGFYNAQGDFRASAPGATDDLWYQNTGASYDCDADWVYMEERANLAVLPIISNRQVMLFQLEDTNGSSGTKTLLPESVTVPTVPNYYTAGTPTWDDYGKGCNPETAKINIWMETWDRIMYAELATLGLIQKSDIDKMNQFYPRWNADGTRGEIYNYDVAADGRTYQEFCRGLDYSEYYNHHGVSLGTESGFMSAGWNAANYNINTLGSLVTMAGNCVDGVNNYAVDIWGPAHEIGHQFQDVFNIRGGTEVTNNVFSNAAVWYQGASTSRYNWGGLDSALSSFNSGTPFIDYNIWAMTQMFYKLWLYYHLAGNNTQFYPRFFEMLRVDPLNAKGATATGTESMLKIYEKMCDAAGEDLTEFFRAHGFFVLLDNYAKGDYGTTIFTQTQEEVDAAIARVKEKSYNPNYAVLLINDLTTEILQHDGVNKRVRFDNTPASEYGTVDEFINGTSTVGGTYTATVNSDGTITMTGEGGIGFLILDETGKLVSFSYNSTFALSDEAMETIMTGNATIFSIGTDVDTDPVAATVDIAVMQKDILGTLIAKAQLIIDKIDETYTKIGFYKSAAVADLATALEYAKEVYTGSSGYEGAYDLLYAEYKKVLANGDAKIPFDSSLTYIITNKAYPTQTMWVNSSKTVRSDDSVDQTAAAAKWQFKETGTNGVYNIYNTSGYYCPAVGESASMTVIETLRPDTIDGLYTLQEMEDGVWAIKLSPANNYRNFHSSWNNVVGWETGNNASRWYLTAVEADPVLADLTNLEVCVNKTEALLNEVLGSVTYTRGDSITLQTTTEGSANYLWSNAPEDSEGNIAYLVDGITGSNSNYFHTEWSSEPVSGTHYIAVDLGAGNAMERFAFSHTTRSGVTNDFPKSVDVYGSDDNVTYKYLGSASDMPQTAGTPWQFDGVMVSPHRYLRFNMHANRGYWHMAEFDIMPVTGFTVTVNDTYSNDVTVTTVEAAVEALLNGKSVINSITPTTESIDPVLKALETAYKNLYTEYETTITTRKKTLAGLVTETNTLIEQAGSVQLAFETPITLTKDNLYCNAPYIASNNGDYCADYVTYLTDGDLSTKLHTRWNANSDDGDYHYLRVDAVTPVDLFCFTYTTASRSKKDMPLTMVVEGANEIDGDNSTKDTFTEITTLTPLPEVLNTNKVYKSSILGSADTPYRYLRFKVTDISVDESDGNEHPFFTMAEFTISAFEKEVITINDTYKSNVSNDLLLTSVLVTNSSDAVSKNELVVSVPMLDAQIADQQAVKNRLYEAMNNIDGLKASLQELIDTTQALYDKMVVDGNVAEYYKTSALTAENITVAQTEIAEAQTIVDSTGVTPDDIATAAEELSAVYDIFVEIESNDYGDKTGLETLISNVETILAEVSDFVTSQTDIALQTTSSTENFYLWSNATAGDCDGIEALIDEKDDGAANTGTFFGTVWSGGPVANYSHYIEVDLGENVAIDEFTFDYITRNSAYENQRPDAIKILCSNDKVNYDEITTISEGLATDANEQWAMSEPLSLGKCYRYIRFAVATDVGYFNMSDFNIATTRMCTIKEDYLSSNLTKELVFDAYRQNNESVAVVNHYTTKDGYLSSLDELQAVYDALTLAMAVKDLPVRLTTDVNNPVLYKIKINRGETKVLEYDGETSSASKKVAVSDTRPTRYQAWYFIEGTDEESFDDIQILPYYNENADNKTLKLGANAISDGTDKVIAVDGSDSSYKTNWYITFKTKTTTDESGNEVTTNVTADGWWNIQPEGKGNYFSNNGGVDQKMGFYNNAGDDGSEFKFVLDDTDYSISEAYYKLYNKHSSYEGERTGGTLIGQCTQETADAYNSVYGAAKIMLENQNSTDAEYVAMYESLVSAYDALVYNMPVEGRFYVLRSAHTDSYAKDGIAYVGDDNGLSFSTTYDATLSRAIWMFEAVDGGYNLKNLHTGDYVGSFPWGGQTFLSSSAGVVKLEILDTANGILKIVSGHPMHAQKSGSVIVGYTGGLGSASAWYIDELSDSDVENIHYPYTLSALGYGTLMLGFDAKIPEGVKAHYAESVSGIYVDMVPIDDVIPANTAVILKSEAELDAALDVDFKYSTTAGTPVYDNMLAGTLYKRVVKCDTDDTNNNVYVMQVKDGVVKMYWAYENYGADGKKVADDNGSYENDLGGYIMCSANRAYLVVAQTNAMQTAMLGLRFGSLATSVDDVESADTPASVYDLQGRKLKEITKPGVYIVDGKKILVK